MLLVGDEEIAYIPLSVVTISFFSSLVLIWVVKKSLLYFMF